MENTLPEADSERVPRNRLSTTVWIGVARPGQTGAVVAVGRGGAAVVLHAGLSWSTRTAAAGAAEAYGGKESGMRVVAQRVSRASVLVGGDTVGAIEQGLVLLVAFAPDDGREKLDWMARKVVGLRIFADGESRMNRSVRDVGGSLLVVSQFTLYGDTSRGLRPSFVGAAPADRAEDLYDRFLSACREEGVRVESGRFGAMMKVELVNDGPVTLILDR